MIQNLFTLALRVATFFVRSLIVGYLTSVLFPAIGTSVPEHLFVGSLVLVTFALSSTILKAK